MSSNTGLIDLLVSITHLSIVFYIFWKTVLFLENLWMGGSNMTERQLLTKFNNVLKKEFPEVFWYKIPDVPGGGPRRPFDVVVCFGGRFFAIEFKKQGGTVAPHQTEYLEKVHADGGYAFIGTFIANGDIEFISIEGGQVYTLHRHGGSFKNFDEFFYNLLKLNEGYCHGRN